MNGTNAITRNNVEVTQDALRRFWTKVQCNGPMKAIGFRGKTHTACWLWTAGKRDGYGLMPAPFSGVRSVNAHRFSWLIHKGRIPDGYLVLHKCDNPTCVRPAHLFLGTTYDNMRDRNRKGRQAWGQRGGNAILTDAQARAIRAIRPKRRAKRGSGGHAAPVARKYGVSVATIHHLWSGRSWRNL